MSFTAAYLISIRVVRGFNSGCSTPCTPSSCPLIKTRTHPSSSKPSIAVPCKQQSRCCTNAAAGDHIFHHATLSQREGLASSSLPPMKGSHSLNKVTSLINTNIYSNDASAIASTLSAWIAQSFSGRYHTFTSPSLAASRTHFQPSSPSKSAHILSASSAQVETFFNFSRFSSCKSGNSAAIRRSSLEAWKTLSSANSAMHSSTIRFPSSWDAIFTGESSFLVTSSGTTFVVVVEQF
mmetsp:Transcript_12887/g.25675  ORF Transcript_12887/g.25675 Transcript_12887/m.25675 type:complete len:237 (-) Transcript_12887:76-786(-)